MTDPGPLTRLAVLDAENRALRQNTVSAEMHRNTINGITEALQEYAPAEWDAARADMVESGNSSYVVTVKLALQSLRAQLREADAENRELGNALAVNADDADGPQPSEIEQALSDAGITLESGGTLRWIFRPKQIEVSSSGGGERARLAGLLTQVAHLIHEIARERDDLKASALPLPPLASRETTRAEELYVTAANIAERAFTGSTQDLIRNEIWEALRKAASPAPSSSTQKLVCKACGHYVEPHTPTGCNGWMPAHGPAKCSCTGFVASPPTTREET